MCHRLPSCTLLRWCLRTWVGDVFSWCLERSEEYLQPVSLTAIDEEHANRAPLAEVDRQARRGEDEVGDIKGMSAHSDLSTRAESVFKTVEAVSNAPQNLRGLGVRILLAFRVRA